VEKSQIAKLTKLKKERDNVLVRQKLTQLKKAAAENDNLVSHLVEASKAYATIGEMIDTLKDVFGEYVEPVEF
jgi:methylmalonyl-CoA mutase N-terminal domain/subunit